MPKKLFGDANDFQSAIQIEAIELFGSQIICRDEVKIDGITGVEVNPAKYDYEAIERGARGNF